MPKAKQAPLDLAEAVRAAFRSLDPATQAKVLAGVSESRAAEITAHMKGTTNAAE